MKSSELLFRFLIAVFFSLIIMLFDSFFRLGWFRGFIEIIFQPETRILSLAAENINRSVAAVRYISSGPARIADLERRLAAAEREAILSVRRQEKTEASPVLDWAAEQGFRLIPAQVLSFGPQLIIEIPPSAIPSERSESRDLVGSPVVSADGALVGAIVSVGRWSVRVKLLSDAGSQIPAAVLNPGKQKMAAGLLSGSFGSAITLEKVLTEIDLRPDLAVVTAGGNDSLPPDLLIGWIGKTGQKQASSVYQKADIVPAAKPAELKLVFIIEPLKH